MLSSPALRYSPGREPRADGHKRGRSLESGLLFREKDDDLALFNEMQSKERESFLLQSSDDLEDTFSTKLRHFSDAKRGISIPARGESSNLLNADADKNDYDWLLTPPDTPLFPSLDDEPPMVNVASRGRPQSKPISISRSSTMEKSYRSSRGSASPNRLSPSPRSRTNTLQSRGRPSSVPNSSPTPSLRYATPSRRPSSPPNKPKTSASRSNSYTPRRLSTGSTGPVVSSGIRGTSPVKTSRGNSESPKTRTWQTNIPGFSSEAPPNLRTSLTDRPASYVRGSSPASRNGRESKSSRQSMSPTASRSRSSFRSHDRDQFSSHSKGSVVSSCDDDVDSIQSKPVGSLDRQGSIRSGSLSTNRTPNFPKKPARMASPHSAPKRLFDSAIRQMDRRSPQDMFRPLLSSVPSTTFYVGNTNSSQRSLVSRNSSVTTSSNASSGQGRSFAVDTEGSDHNHDDMTSETDKMLYPDIHEVFAFDKIDLLNENEESVDVQHNETRDPKIDFDPTEFEDSVHHGGIDADGNENSETTCNRGDIYETGSSENTAICSNCGCRYEVTEQAEKHVVLCPECSRKSTLLRVVTPETTLTVSKDSSVIYKNMPEEEKSLSETDRLTVASELPQDTDAGELRFHLSEKDAREYQTSCSERIHDHSQNSSIPSSSEEGGVETDQPGVNYEKPNNDFGYQKLNCSSDPPNLNVNLMEGTGISVLLKRSSSNKGPILQGRSFTATTISYDDLSLARDSVNSTRSSTRHGSYSASSSVDLSSVRQAEIRVQRQLSGRKLDVEFGYDLGNKPPSTYSSFSGTSNHSHHGLLLTNLETSSNTDSGFVEETPQVLREMKASEITVVDVTDASSVSLIGVEEDKCEYDDNSRLTKACSSKISSQAAVIVKSDDNSGASFPNHGDCISYENVEDDPNNASVLSFHEKHDVQNSNVDEPDALVTTNSSQIVEPEIEVGKNYCENNIGTVNDDLSLVSKSALDEFQELSTQNPSSDCLTASVSELNTSEYSHGIEGSTVTVDCQAAGNTKSLTLDEATDTILFCSSIIHDLAYQAATMAMEKECSEPFEGSELTVTLIEKSNSNRKDTHSRTVRKRASKSQKARQGSAVETTVRPSSGKTENDENLDKSFTQNSNNNDDVGLPNKVDSDSMKPLKLESKCNCIIM
ncbi:hypothetical protein TanjilG_11009 [Lupinus angustifolius]|uniref:Uncharacterized protein n=1 Tax=Lupinus angustifolius TaxID=3871 RepID=A0A1J7GAU8_LUPAN|nr:PREDICTED: uncharacterized protein LOC109328286 [Lupinus angustifolius]XP_019417231.1 PREDICTED: uncharacterized protein LOC109328286 [Lupinus angustifolius]XP_019417232.1 PREDICTED: uncharacterized protein LOC109328286 [Lupinus angustifolius]OIV97485.1 hypothetical protein TanjilG_11009 [Lupinus angustifolius]